MAVVVVSVSFAAPLFRLAEAPPVTASFWRLALAVALLLPFAGRAWRTWQSYGPQAWGVTLVSGLALAAHFGLWVTSLYLTSVAAATVLVTLQAVFVALGGHFLLGDRLGHLAWVGVGVAVAGGLVIAIGHGAGVLPGASAKALQGDVLALLAGLGSAAYMLLGRRLRQNRGLVEYVLPVYAVAAGGLLVWALAFGEPVLQSVGHSQSFLIFVLLAAVPMLGGHTVSNWVIRYIPAHVVATWILLEPVGAALLAIPLLGGWPGPWTLVGGVLVLLGAALTVRPHRRPATLAPPA